MSEHRTIYIDGNKLTKLSEALARKLQTVEEPLLSNYALFRYVWHFYENKSVPYLRGFTPSADVFRRTRRSLSKEGFIRPDADYSRFWRNMGRADHPADETVCIADNYTYVSHLSAMQRYGLTNRRPRALFVTQLAPAVVGPLLAKRMQEDYGNQLDIADYIEPLQYTHHPKRVRGRAVNRLARKELGEWRAVKSTWARIASIGQTFLDMLDAPERCGGMGHVLDVWENHAPTYIDEIVTRFEASGQPIHKVRAGYILTEKMGIDDLRIAPWKQYAQRGGSRVLDPSKPFAPTYSEDWMLSLNVE